jgi:hypothetical protein
MRIGISLFATVTLLQLPAQQLLPRPYLVYKGATDNPSHFTQYNFAVSNYSSYSDELFRWAPDLPAVRIEPQRLADVG